MHAVSHLPSRTRLLALTLLLAHWWLAANPTQAGSGGSFVLPMPGATVRSGLQIQVAGHGVDANGYRPIRIEVSPLPAGAFTEDRQIRVVLKPNEYYQQTTLVEQIIDLPEGSTKVTAIVAVPQTNQWHQFGFVTYEGGDRLEDVSADWLGWNNHTYGQWSEATPALLVIDRNVPLRAVREARIGSYQGLGTDNQRTFTLPDIRTLAWIFPDPIRGFVGGTVAPGTSPAAQGRLSDTELLTHIERNLSRVEMLPPAELSKRWIDFSQFDVVVVAADELSRLATSRPKSLDSIRQWVRSGRVLLVTGAGDQFSSLATLEKHLQLSPLPASNKKGARYRAWQRPDPRHATRELQNDWFDPARAAQPWNVRRYGGATTVPIPVGGAAEPAATSSSGGGPASAGVGKTPPFVSRPAGLGVVVAIAAKEPFPGQESDWIWIFNSIPKNQWMWYQRVGFSLHRQNDDYWTFLIPGVGEAPVISFLLLVSLFAVVIGPINYVFLGRARRLYLLLLTVPAGALLVTLALFAYAVFNDGLGVRLRARSFADLDQTTGHAAGAARLSYFAALTPSRGLQLPEDATIFPIEYEPANQTGRSQSTKQRLVWDGRQNLQRGYLSARTPTQYMVDRSTKSSAKVIVQEGQRPGAPPDVENQLGQTILFLLLRDSRGEYFSGRDLRPQSQAKLEPAMPAAVEKELAAIYNRVKPDYPRGYDPTMHHNSALSWLLPNFNRNSGVDSGSADPSMAGSLLERNIFLSLRPTIQPPPPGSYVAVTARSVIIPTGLPSTGEEASLHVLQGRYRR